MAIWYLYLRNTEPHENQSLYYWNAGLTLTGLTLLGIGFGLGRIGRAARHAEMPPPEATEPAANAEQLAAARAPIMAPVNPAMPMAPGAMPGMIPPGAAPVMPGAVVPPAPQSPTVPEAPRTAGYPSRTA